MLDQPCSVPLSCLALCTLEMLRLVPAEVSFWWPADYKFSLQGKEGEERQNAMNACHSRGAWQLQKLCFANGGEEAVLQS